MHHHQFFTHHAKSEGFQSSAPIIIPDVSNMGGKSRRSPKMNKSVLQLHSNLTLLALQVKWDTIKLSFNSTGGLIGSWLFCIQHFPCSIRFWCMLGVRCGGVEWRPFYIGSFEGNTHFGYAKRCQNELGPQMNQYRMLFVQIMHQNLTEHGKCCMRNNQLPTKTPVELNDNSNIIQGGRNCIYASARRGIEQVVQIGNCTSWMVY